MLADRESKATAGPSHLVFSCVATAGTAANPANLQPTERHTIWVWFGRIAAVGVLFGLIMAASAPNADARLRTHITRTHHRARTRTAMLARRVNIALRADRKLNGVYAYPVSPGVVAIDGRVFEEEDSRRAEQTASEVAGVRHVINHLQTTTGQWMAQQVALNNAMLQDKPLQGVTVHVLGREAFLWGDVRSEADKEHAAQLASSMSNLQVVNLVRVVPGNLFGWPWFTRETPPPATTAAQQQNVGSSTMVAQQNPPSSPTVVRQNPPSSTPVTE